MKSFRVAQCSVGSVSVELAIVAVTVAGLSGGTDGVSRKPNCSLELMVTGVIKYCN
jgi:hypothetical protein